ncbi:MAG: hypothetical protein JJU27_10260 [Gammaproteobacteria bacterium]|nr:hypothetical protein [Gammaproteobacteria bacterium]
MSGAAGAVRRLVQGCTLAVALGVPSTYAADNAAAPWQFSGDARGGVFISERRARDGARSDEQDLRLRLRLAAERPLGSGWSLRARLAGSWSADDPATRVYLRASTPTGSGTDRGDVTVDELQLNYRADSGDWWLKVGRLQSRFLLQGVASKSLDRNDSSNVGINWTDGVHVSHALGGGWRSHVVLEHHPAGGGGSTRRTPLDFSSSSSRIAGFAGLENLEAAGPIVQRMLALTWKPSALASEGVAAARRDDYVLLVGRVAAQWPLGQQGMRLLAGAEAGIAPDTQRLPAADGQPGRRASGSAWQASINLYDIRPGHHLGLVHGRAGAGWLLSTDYRNDDRLTELRYQRRFSPQLSLEARVRLRRELSAPAGLRDRIDQDAYLRLSGRF